MTFVPWGFVSMSRRMTGNAFPVWLAPMHANLMRLTLKLAVCLFQANQKGQKQNQYEREGFDTITPETAVLLSKTLNHWSKRWVSSITFRLFLPSRNLHTSKSVDTLFLCIRTKTVLQSRTFQGLFQFFDREDYLYYSSLKDTFSLVR